jgi:hypothetical protein
MKKFILIVTHDRHTDDTFKLFKNTPENIEKVKELCQQTFPEGSFAYNYGDWCWYINEDYHCYYELVDLEEPK